MFDFDLDFGGIDLMPSISGEGWGEAPTLDHPPLAQTRVAALLVAGLALPGVLLIVLGVFLVTRPNDLLAPIIGMAGIVGMAIGVCLAAYAVSGAWAVWRRKPRARLWVLMIGGFLMLLGPMGGLIGGGALGMLFGLGMVLYGGALVLAMLGPGIRADFPGPVWTPRNPAPARVSWFERGLRRR
ncbi:MAG: hypothetical protein QOG53_1017 [Frankiales bacterium]|jgi:hypothetical protein|nr:hypothetical protein [Frankiales bacterium]